MIRIIDVSNTVSGNTMTATISGSRFTPSSAVVIKITDKNLQQKQFPQTSEADEKFASRHQVSCVSGAQLIFTPYADADPIGTFGNAFIITCLEVTNYNIWKKMKVTKDFFLFL